MHHLSFYCKTSPIFLLLLNWADVQPHHSLLVCVLRPPPPCPLLLLPPAEPHHWRVLPGPLRLLGRSLLQRVFIAHNLSHQAWMSATSLAPTLLPAPRTHPPPPLSPPSSEAHMKALLCFFGFLSLPPLSVLHSLFIQSSLATHSQLHSSLLPAFSVGQAAHPCCPPLHETSF